MDIKQPLRINRQSKKLREIPLEELFRLPVLAMPDRTCRNTGQLRKKIMSQYKAYVSGDVRTNDGNTRYELVASLGNYFFDTSNGTTLASVNSTDVPYSDAPNGTLDEIRAKLSTLIVAEAAGNGYTGFDANDIEFGVAFAQAPVESVLSLSLQTSTGAVGTLVDANRNAWVTLNGNASSTASIAGNASADIIVEIAPTNSATAGDWVEKGRIANSQALSLALTLQSIQVTKSAVTVFVPKGYYIKARSVGTGTFSNTLGVVRKVLI